VDGEVTAGGWSAGRGAGTANESTPRDPGAQPERTRLAWRRTTLTYAVALGLCVRRLLGGDPDAVTGAAVAVGGLTLLVFLAVAHLRIAGMAASRPRAMTPGIVGAAAMCTLVMALAGVALLW
jgi:uncharacterized membrane protein YidH (DUF202 family)